MARITAAFDRLRGGNGPGLVAYVTAGDPSLERTAVVRCKALPRVGFSITAYSIPQRQTPISWSSRSLIPASSAIAACSERQAR